MGFALRFTEVIYCGPSPTIFEAESTGSWLISLPFGREGRRTNQELKPEASGHLG
jgi:hypothetical protein